MLETGIKKEVDNYQPFKNVNETAEEEFDKYFRDNITLDNDGEFEREKENYVKTHKDNLLKDIYL